MPAGRVSVRCDVTEHVHSSSPKDTARLLWRAKAISTGGTDVGRSRADVPENSNKVEPCNINGAGVVRVPWRDARGRESGGHGAVKPDPVPEMSTDRNP
ncbi:hypothetical protein INR49_010648 [Caranx melampygus]|nr:hypothetical protein INR49_010648 [Caranx melampygus]